MSDDSEEIQALTVLATSAAGRLGGPVASAIVYGLAGVVGPALLRGVIDEWEAARAPSNAAFRAKFKEEP